MQTFKVPVGLSQRLLRIEPQGNNVFKIYADDKAQDWLDHEKARSVDVPEDGLLGTITVRAGHDFDFDGSGAFSGNELLGVAEQIVRHPEFGS